MFVSPLDKRMEHTCTMPTTEIFRSDKSIERGWYWQCNVCAKLFMVRAVYTHKMGSNDFFHRVEVW